MHSWILVADGSRAHLYSRESELPALLQVHSWDCEGGRTADHLSETDRLGSGGGGRGRHGSAMAAETSPKQHSKEVFAKELAAYLYEHAASYGQLLVVAPPACLGELRKLFHSTVSKKILGELNKDLTHVALHALPPHLASFFAVP